MDSNHLPNTAARAGARLRHAGKVIRLFPADFRAIYVWGNGLAAPCVPRDIQPAKSSRGPGLPAPVDGLVKGGE
jgi:hypothetical protein